MKIVFYLYLVTLLFCAARQSLPPTESLKGHEAKSGTSYLYVDRLVDSSLVAWNHQWLFEQLEGPKLWVVISQWHSTVVIQGQVAVVSTNADICDPNLGNLSPTNLDALASIKIDHMDSFRGSLSHWLNNHVILDPFMYLVVQQVELLSVFPMLDIFEWVLANLTL